MRGGKDTRLADVVETQKQHHNTLQPHTAPCMGWGTILESIDVVLYRLGVCTSGGKEEEENNNIRTIHSEKRDEVCHTYALRSGVLLEHYRVVNSLSTRTDLLTSQNQIVRVRVSL